MEEVKRIGNLYGEDRGTGFAGNVWDKDGISPTITTMQGGGREPMIIDTINDEEGICKTIKSQYGKTSAANFVRTSTFGASGVVEKKIKKCGQISSEGSEYGTVIHEDGICTNLVAGTHGYANNCISVKQATKEGSIKCKVGGCYDASYPGSTTRRGRVQEGGDVTPTITAQGGENINYVETQYRIRKLTPKECWRLMGYTDEDFEKAAFEIKELYIQGDNDKCNARLKAVQEKPKHTDMESFVSCTINDTKSMETLKIIKKLLAETPENEKTQNVNFVITKSEDLERSECAANTTKCITFMGMQCILTEGKDQQVMVITEQEKEDKQNTGKFMKIITELNSNPLKLYTILILTAQIIKSKIYGSTTLRANIQGNIAITDVCENSILLKISDLRMENTSVRVSSSQLYKQAGNAIVKQVLMAIFSQMNIKGVKPWNDMTLEEKYKLIRKSTSEEKK